MRRIAVGMILYDEVSGFVHSVVGDKKPRGFRQEPDEATDDAWAEQLQPQRETPVKIGREVEVRAIHSFPKQKVVSG